jgi:hypothetical protein
MSNEAHEKGIEAAQEALSLCCKEDMILAIKAYLSASGLVLVPSAPTKDMVDFARQHHEGEAYLPYSLYAAFITSAPNPFESKQDE